METPTESEPEEAPVNIVLEIQDNLVFVGVDNG